MDKFQALDYFWNSFSVPAYDTTSVPDNATMPYMTYEVATDSFNNSVMTTNGLWYNSTSWAAISQKVQEISEAIGSGGVLIPFDDGNIWVRRGTPFAQRMSTEKGTVKRYVLNFIIDFNSEN